MGARSMTNQHAVDRLAVVLSWIALLLLGVLAVAPLVPPTPPAGQDGTAFSAARALDYIERFAVEPRPIGTTASARARADIVAQLRLLGLEPELQTIEARDYYSPRGETIEVVNVIARIPGTAPTTAVALMGHYDTVPSTAGANDDASAVAIMLEAARAILAGDRLRNDVILLFTDGEEPAPRFGSTAFIAHHPWAGDIGFVINLEALGTGGPSLLIGMNGPGRWVVSQFTKALPYPTAFSFLTATTELIGGSNTDFATFRDIGISGVDLAYLHGSPVYHTMADAPDRVSLRSLQHQGANALALARHIGNLEAAEPQDDSSAVFFTVGRFHVVRYPVAWALPIAVLSGVVLVVAGWRQRSWLRSLLSAGTTLATTTIAAIAAVGIWTVLGGWRGTMGIAESYAYLAGLMLLTAGIGAVVARLTRRRTGAGSDGVGVVAVWWALGLLTAITAPGMSCLFVWPALVGGLTLLWRLPTGGRWWRLARWVLVSGTALVLLVPAIDVFYILAQPRPGNPDSEILAVIAVPVVLLALGIELLRVFRVRSLESSDIARRNATTEG